MFGLFFKKSNHKPCIPIEKERIFLIYHRHYREENNQSTSLADILFGVQLRKAGHQYLYGNQDAMFSDMSTELEDRDMYPLEMKLRAELFGRTFIHNYESSGPLGYVQYNDNLDMELPEESDIVYGDRSPGTYVEYPYDRRFMEMYEQELKPHLKREYPAMYKRFVAAELESTTDIESFTSIYFRDVVDPKLESDYRNHCEFMTRINTEVQAVEDQKREEADREWRAYVEANSTSHKAQQAELSGRNKAIQDVNAYVQKGYVLALDTNILLHYSDLFASFKANVILSKQVYDELDHLKTKSEHISKMARKFFNEFEQAQVNQIDIPLLKADREKCRALGLNPQKPDELIIAGYLSYQQEEHQKKVLFLSDDRGARILARSYGLEVLDERVLADFGKEG